MQRRMAVQAKGGTGCPLLIGAGVFNLSNLLCQFNNGCLYAWAAGAGLILQ